MVLRENSLLEDYNQKDDLFNRTRIFNYSSLP